MGVGVRWSWVWGMVGRLGFLHDAHTNIYMQMRLTVREFVEGYKEGRDHSAEEVQAAIRKQVSD